MAADFGKNDETKAIIPCAYSGTVFHFLKKWSKLYVTLAWKTWNHYQSIIAIGCNLQYTMAVAKSKSSLCVVLHCQKVECTPTYQLQLV